MNANHSIKHENEGGSGKAASAERTPAISKCSSVQSKILGDNNQTNELSEILSHSIPTATITINPNHQQLHANMSTSSENTAKNTEINQFTTKIKQQYFDGEDDEDEEPLDVSALSNDEQSNQNSNSSLDNCDQSPTSQQNSRTSKCPNNLDDRKIRRQIANCNERRRMQSINAGFQALRQFLPQRCGEKLSKAAILQQTAELIQSLQLENNRRRAQTGAEDEHQQRCKSANDAMQREERPTQSKKRKIAIKNERKFVGATSSEESSSAKTEYLEAQIADYIKMIDELRTALAKEHQLRLLYEQKFADLRATLLTNLGFNVAPNENVQAAHPQQRSNSADILTPKINIPYELGPISPSSLCSNLIAELNQLANYNGNNNNVHLVGQPAGASQLAFLSPTNAPINGYFTGQNQPFSSNGNNLPATNELIAPLASNAMPIINQLLAQQTNISDRNTLAAILLNTLHQNNGNSKNFVGESPSADVLVR